MNAILKLEQGTPEWHKHRAKYRNASETPAIMGASPWTSVYDLWLLKTGRKTQPETEAMRHGTAMEPIARLAYEIETGTIMQPKVMVNGLYSASLDGITLNGELLVEIKVPYQGQVSELWQQAKQGIAPEHYYLQVQHQLMVSGAKLAHLWVFDGSKGIKIEIAPDPKTFEHIKSAWDDFQNLLDTDTAPPLSEQDTLLRQDDGWRQAAELFITLKSKAEEAAEQADDAKSKLISLATHSRENGSGVSVTRYWKQGSVDYKSIPALQSVDLDSYRGKAKEEVRVTVVKDKEL
jgi:putative phage-type endonuclease